MVRVILLNQNSYSDSVSDKKARRKETAQEVAAGTGVAGAASYQAKRYSTKQVLNGMLTKVTEASRAAGAGTKEVTGLWGKFKFDVANFSKSIMNNLKAVESWKIIGPIVKSPLMKGTAHFFGVGMAFFALVTGIDKAFRNGKLMTNDIKSKLGLVA